MFSNTIIIILSRRYKLQVLQDDTRRFASLANLTVYVLLIVSTSLSFINDCEII